MIAFEYFFCIGNDITGPFCLTNFLNLAQPSWITDDEFGMGYLEIKPAPAPSSKSVGVNSVSVQNGVVPNATEGEPSGGRNGPAGISHSDYGNSTKDTRIERSENASLKSDIVSAKMKGGSLGNGSDQSSGPSIGVQSGTSKSVDNQKQLDEPINKASEETTKMAAKTATELEVCPYII